MNIIKIFDAYSTIRNLLQEPGIDLYVSIDDIVKYIIKQVPQSYYDEYMKCVNKKPFEFFESVKQEGKVLCNTSEYIEDVCVVASYMSLRENMLLLDLNQFKSLDKLDEDREDIIIKIIREDMSEIGNILKRNIKTRSLMYLRFKLYDEERYKLLIYLIKNYKEYISDMILVEDINILLDNSYFNEDEFLVVNFIIELDKFSEKIKEITEACYKQIVKSDILHKFLISVNDNVAIKTFEYIEKSKCQEVFEYTIKNRNGFKILLEDKYKFHDVTYKVIMPEDILINSIRKTFSEFTNKNVENVIIWSYSESIRKSKMTTELVNAIVETGLLFNRYLGIPSDLFDYLDYEKHKVSFDKAVELKLDVSILLKFKNIENHDELIESLSDLLINSNYTRLNCKSNELARKLIACMFNKWRTVYISNEGLESEYKRYVETQSVSKVTRLLESFEDFNYEGDSEKAKDILKLRMSSFNEVLNIGCARVLVHSINKVDVSLFNALDVNQLKEVLLSTDCAFEYDESLKRISIQEIYEFKSDEFILLMRSKNFGTVEYNMLNEKSATLTEDEIILRQNVFTYNKSIYEKLNIKDKINSLLDLL